MVHESALTRVVVVGSSCSGKTTFARSLAEIVGSPHVELDALHWGPNCGSLAAAAGAV
jgi:adenylate kinase family enzyme